MSEEFRPVTRKKWLARNNMQKRPRRISDRIQNADSVQVDMDKFLKRIQKACDDMSKSDYFVQSMATLDESLAVLGVKNRNELKHLVCFGIGPFTCSFQAFHQLSFILSAQRHCGIKTAYYYDPVFLSCEKELLMALDCEVMSENCEAKYKATELILIYMPHCPHSLTNNLLWQNWRPAHLKNLVLINNSFEELCTTNPEGVLKLDSNYMLDILSHVKEFPLEDNYKAKNVFNDLSVHVFPLDGIPKDDSDFWKQQPAPVYNNDVEMIYADQFAKLSITIP